MNINKLAKTLTCATLGATLMAASAIANPVAQLPNKPSAKFNSNETTTQHAFLLYKYILDAGARANGTKRESADSSGKHATWCARWNKTYDAGSNTIAGFNGARLPCISPYGG